MRTITDNLSDGAIKRHFTNPEIREIRDPRYPLRLRVNQSRTRGSWYVVRYAGGRANWRKVGNWPVLSSKAMLSILPEVMAQMEIHPDASVNGLVPIDTVADLMGWYLERVQHDGSLSDKRKTGIRTVTNRQILPTIGEKKIRDLIPSTVDRVMMWELQKTYKPGTISQAWRVLKSATRRAHSLRLLDSDPLVDLKFSDFISTPLQPKASRLRSAHTRDVIEAAYKHTGHGRLLPLLMLMHGTRIGETRAARWDHFDLDHGWWYIPGENTKTGRPHRLPLTAQAKKLLRDNGWSKKRPGYLFPSAKNTRRPIPPTSASELIGKVSAGKWSAHDLRKLARTAWMDLGTDYLVAEFMLNHTLRGVDKTYIHTHADTQMRQSLSTYHEWLNKQGL